ncbi:hypothetical protein [Novosphingobium sp. ST904]|uniref:hypothetical protein n=1 Tax=Novosphingobium sp. ST904 TaxID=1684385 RepID=UPI000AEFB85A|nr:hypothetical protein [Novosphingobium sp. ST904]TCM40594.1 hypothetical protein EDF59_10467 [Novosphingobium sp. ST904]
MVRLCRSLSRVMEVQVIAIGSLLIVPAAGGQVREFAFDVGSLPKGAPDQERLPDDQEPGEPISAHPLPADPGRVDPGVPPAGSPGAGWTLIVSPYAWGASLGGDLGLAGLQHNLHLPFRDIFKHVDLAAMGTIEAVNDRWGGYLDAQRVKTSQAEAVRSLPVDLDIRTRRLAGGFYYKAWQIPLPGKSAFGAGRDISIEPTAGLRWTHLRARAGIAPLAVQTTGSAGWVDPFAGLRVNADLSRHWNLFTQADLGGFGAGSDLSVNAVAMLGYRTRLMGRRTILRGGYRFLYEKYDQSDFTNRGRFIWDMQQRGPLLGMSVLF